jgi:diguanylate cyclase
MLARPVNSARQELLAHLSANRLLLHFQPQFCLTHQSVTGFEGVVRWHHDSLGVLLPGVFLGLAQREGLLPKLTRMLLEQAGGAAAGWSRNGHQVQVAVNLGADDLDDVALAADAVAAVRDYGATPERISLEINEEFLIDADRAKLDRLADLRAAGFSLALDAKGVPVVKLQELPAGLITQLKCGGMTMLKVAERLRRLNASSFLRRVETARHMGMSIVAVGAETDDALTSFVRAGFTHVQGDILAPPLEYAATHAFLERPAG